MSPGVLERLLAADNHPLRGGGANRDCRCWFPDRHKRGDRSHSMSVDVVNNVWNCHGCGLHGGVKDYLTLKRGMTEDAAKQYMRDLDPQPEPVAAKGLWEQLPREDVVAVHEYRRPDGAVAFVALRHRKGSVYPRGRRKGEAKPKLMPWTRLDGGWKPGLDQKSIPPGDRPLYGLPALAAADSERQVVVVEGEKAADAFLEHLPKSCVTTWHGGSKAWHITDWRPLAGRKVVLVADADEPGRTCMERLALYLSGASSKEMRAAFPDTRGRLPKRGMKVPAGEIRIALPPGDTGEDAADWAADGARGIARNLKRYVQAWTKPADSGTPELPVFEIPESLYSNDYFEVLGNVQDQVAVRLRTNRILEIGRPSLTSPAQLIALADFHFWTAMTGTQSLPPGACQPIGSALIRKADQLGQVDLGRIAGRGLFRTSSGKLVWHLGDQLRHEGQRRDLTHFGAEMIAVSGPPLRVGAKACTVAERRAAARAVLSYRWNEPHDGRAFLGWMVAALVGGGLEWRPHAWLAAPAEAGKSWLFRHVAKAFFGDFCVQVADGTAPGIARYMRSDSLPLLVDEAEPERNQMGALLDLARIAAGADGMRLRADSSEGVSACQPRFTAMLASTKVAQLDEADRSRFAIIELGAKVEDWPAVDQAIRGALTPEICGRLRAGLLLDAHGIVAEASEAARQFGRMGIGTRAAHIYGALTAGWHWWMPDSKAPVLKDDRNEAVEDAVQMLRAIFGLRVRKGESDISLALLLQRVRTNPRDEASRVLAGDHGLKLDKEGAIMLAPTHEALRSKLQRGRWKNISVKRVLTQIKGVTSTPNAIRFGSHRERALRIPSATAERCGVMISADPESVESAPPPLPPDPGEPEEAPF